MSERSTDAACPRCRARAFIPVIYGLPDSIAAEAEERGELVLAGCCVGEDAPDRKCKRCRHQYWSGLPETVAAG